MPLACSPMAFRAPSRAAPGDAQPVPAAPGRRPPVDFDPAYAAPGASTAIGSRSTGGLAPASARCAPPGWCTTASTRAAVAAGAVPVGLETLPALARHPLPPSRPPAARFRRPAGHPAGRDSPRRPIAGPFRPLSAARHGRTGTHQPVLPSRSAPSRPSRGAWPFGGTLRCSSGAGQRSPAGSLSIPAARSAFTRRPPARRRAAQPPHWLPRRPLGSRTPASRAPAQFPPAPEGACGVPKRTYTHGSGTPGSEMKGLRLRKRVG